ncbi:MAG: carbon-nitrogen hydrolase family protein [Nannocystaceae bacterium]|nr:carbon-nitrogen hydrolase family protein [Nannocystaceae bacterium]
MVSVRVALISEVFTGDDAAARLHARLREASDRGAALAVLPELPLQPWRPCSRERLDADAEPRGGAREQLAAAAARQAGLALVAGGIVALPDGRRHNVAWVHDHQGTALGRYAKTHVPQEPGFWERDHYDDGDAAPEPIAVAGLLLALQICSDIQRPALSQALAAAGCHAIVHPRATEPETWPSWRLTLQATALAAGVWVLSVNRPAPEGGTPLGGPSCVVAPDGTVVLESNETIALASIDDAAVVRAQTQYPGYLPLRSDLYAAAWSRVPPRGSLA